MFKLWMKKHHPGFPIWNVDHVNGSRQQICVTGLKYAYLNRAACIEFLCYLLRNKEKDNKLELRYFFALTSLEMTRTLRGTRIMSIATSEKMMWLSA